MTSKKYLFYVNQNYSFAILRPLQLAINKRGGIVKWFLHGSEINKHYIQTGESQLEDISSVIEYNPDAVFIPGNVVPSFIPGIKVGVFHGFNSGKLNRKGKEDHFNIRGCFDIYCTQGPNTTERFKELANKHKHFLVQETGWPAIDPLFKPPAEMKSNQPTVLMCSTFSRNLTCAPILFEKIKEYYKGDLKGKTIAVWGLSFKPETDDIREAPAITIISRLLNQGAVVKAFDPEAMTNFKDEVTDQIEYCDNQYQALENADALAIITEWSIFRSPNFTKMKELMKGRAIFDGRNLFNNEDIKEQGFHYESIGRP